jgi:hypothetical protein
MKIVFQLTDDQIAYGIKLEQRADCTFRLTYGVEVRDHLNYGDAADALGRSMLHALSCDGKIDNREI